MKPTAIEPRPLLETIFKLHLRTTTFENVEVITNSNFNGVKCNYKLRINFLDLFDQTILSKEDLYGYNLAYTIRTVSGKMACNNVFHRST